MKNFDRATLATNRAELNAVLAKYGNEAGLQFELGSMKFSDQSFEVKMSCKIQGGQSLKDKALVQMMEMFNLQENGVGGRILKSYNSRQYKYPFIYEQGGKMFKCSQEQAVRYFAK